MSLPGAEISRVHQWAHIVNTRECFLQPFELLKKPISGPHQRLQQPHPSAKHGDLLEYKDRKSKFIFYCFALQKLKIWNAIVPHALCTWHQDCANGSMPPPVVSLPRSVAISPFQKNVATSSHSLVCPSFSHRKVHSAVARTPKQSKSIPPKKLFSF